MEKTKKDFQIEFCSDDEDSSYTTIGLTLAMLASSFNAIDGFPWFISMAFLLLGLALPAYDFCTKAGESTATTGEKGQLKNQSKSQK